MLRLAPASLVFVLATTTACGGRTQPRPFGASTTTPDAGADAAGLPAGFDGVWRFHTIRALCDTFAVAFCGDHVLTRLSIDDSCDGSNPVDPAPVLSSFLRVDDDTLRVVTSVAGERVVLLFDLFASADTISLSVVEGMLPSFFGDEIGGTRDAGEGVLPADFISCE